MDGLLPTTVMGSYPQPGWLVDRERLVGGGVPRVRDEGIWKVYREFRREFLSRDAARSKLASMVAGAQIVRSEIQPWRPSE